MNQQPLLSLLFLLNYTCAICIVEIVHLFVFVGRLIAEEGMSAFRIVECDVIMYTVKELSFGFVVAVIQLFSLHVCKEGFADRVSIT